MIARDLEFELSIEPGWNASAEPLEFATLAALQRLYADIGPQAVTVQVGPTDTADVSGHAAYGTTVDVMLNLGDDVEGHAFSLRFPSQDDAQRMRTRLAAGGLLVAVLAVGSVSIGAQLTAPHPVTVPVIEAVPQAPDAPFISRGLTADIRSGDIVLEEAPAPTPFFNRGLAADIRSGDIVNEEAGPPPALRGPKKD